jgi:pilus assembly protein Flp/PilA
MFTFLRDESGATAIEYGLIVAAIGLALVAVMPSVSSGLEATFSSVASGL